MIAVTTFSKSGYETYVQKMIDSVLLHWPTKLIIYTEFPLEIDNDKIEVRNLFAIPAVQPFLTYIKGIPQAFGKVEGGYNYNFDLWRFCRKLFAQYDVLQQHKGKVFWLDADLYILKNITEDWLEKLFDGHPLVFLGREGLYTETGFIGFDTEYDRFDIFLENYINCLKKGVVFQLPGWQDCEVFDWARKKTGFQERNLSKFFQIPKNKQMTRKELDVMHRSVLKDHILHYKGNGKEKLTKKY
jgi:hypothetical protein